MSENRLIDGVELEGLEYMDADEARNIKFARETILSIKVGVFNSIMRGMELLGGRMNVPFQGEMVLRQRITYGDGVYLDMPTGTQLVMEPTQSFGIEALDAAGDLLSASSLYPAGSMGLNGPAMMAKNSPIVKTQVGKVFKDASGLENTPGRRGAFRQAKRKLGIPVSQQPKKVIKPGTPEGDAVKPTPLDSRNRRLYEFDNDNVIREDFSDPKTSQNQHFNYGRRNDKLRGHSPEGSNLKGGGFKHKP